MAKPFYAWVTGLLLVLIALSPLAGEYWLHVVILGLYGAMAALGLNVFMGYIGNVSIASGAFLGIGAYTSAYLNMNHGVSFWLTLPTAALLSALVALTIGGPILRIRGVYFALATLALSAEAYEIEIGWESVTRGIRGFEGIPSPTGIDSRLGFFVLALAMVLAVLLINYVITRTELYRAMRACRGDDLLARSIGIKVHLIRLLGFVYSAFWAGAAGAFYAHYVHFLSPETFGLWQAAFEIVVLVTIGGAGNLIGPFIAAILLSVAPELLRATAEYRLIFYCVLLLVVVMAMPRGIGGILDDIARRFTPVARPERAPGVAASSTAREGL